MSRRGDWPLAEVVEAKRAVGGTVSVVLPARNEEATVGPIVAPIRRRLMQESSLVDDLLVVDSGSADRTASIADDAGARVLSRAEILPWLPIEPGKGEVLWRSLFATSGEFVCFVDADLRDFDAAIIPALLGPLFTDSCVALIKAAYVRPLALPGSTAADKGGRVTDLIISASYGGDIHELHGGIVIPPHGMGYNKTLQRGGAGLHRTCPLRHPAITQRSPC